MVRLACRRGYRILATSHRPCAGFTTVYQTWTSPQIIETITSRLTLNESLWLKKAIREELQRRELSTVSNVRDLLFELYDVVANLHDDRSRHRSPATRI
jgi:hypothetical protein